MSWSDTVQLSIKHLRLKTITLLALTFMVLPSDLVPNGVYYDPKLKQTVPFTFCKDHVVFEDDGSLTLISLVLKMTLHIQGLRLIFLQHLNIS